MWLELGIPGNVESLDVLELPKDEEEEAIDRVVAAVFPQDNWVANIVGLAVTADSYCSLVFRSRNSRVDTNSVKTVKPGLDRSQ